MADGFAGLRGAHLFGRRGPAYVKFTPLELRELGEVRDVDMVIDERDFDLDDPYAGFCVAVHEMAHKLDALDGVLDGTPPLPREWQRDWARDFQLDYDAFVAAVDAGREVAIDPYAAEAPEEFFAVCSEYHFSDAATLRSAMPEVAAHLQRFYGAPLLA